jgi:three-Cys-motif partner protein
MDNAEVILTFATDHLIDYLSNREPSKIVRNPGLDLVELASGLEKSNPRWKRAIQVNLHEQIIRNTEAKFYTPFFIRSTDSHKDLWLIHLSRHFRAKDVMTGLHWKLKNSILPSWRGGAQHVGLRS